MHRSIPKKTTAVLLALGLGIASTAASAQATKAFSSADELRNQITENIINTQLRIIDKEFVPKTILGFANASTKDRAKFGTETTSQLVFTPLAPCTLMDTRFGTTSPYNNRIGVGATVSLSVNDSLAEQGGNAAGCGVPGADPAAIAVAVTAIFASSGGTFKAWGSGSEPDGIIGNYGVGSVETSFAIIPLNQGVAEELNLKSVNGNPFVNVSVVGYYTQPTATELNCTTEVAGPFVWAVNTLTVNSATCPTGFSVTGGGFTMNEGSLGVPQMWLYRSIPAGNSWQVVIDNQTNGNRSATVYARCCRTPGQ